MKGRTSEIGTSNGDSEEIMHQNISLRQQLKEALNEIKSLREENADLRSRLEKHENHEKAKTKVAESDMTFVTNGSDLPVRCDNCDKEIPRQNLELHMTYCLRNIGSCKYCNAKLSHQELENHISSAQGTITDRIVAIQSNKWTTLTAMAEHGADLAERNQEDNENSLIHYAVRDNRPEIVKSLLMNTSLSANIQNCHGETPLHFCCDSSDKVELAEILLDHGADITKKNLLGDNPYTLAQRRQNHDLMILFNNRCGHAGVRPLSSYGR